MKQNNKWTSNFIFFIASRAFSLNMHLHECVEEKYCWRKKQLWCQFSTPSRQLFFFVSCMFHRWQCCLWWQNRPRMHIGNCLKCCWGHICLHSTFVQHTCSKDDGARLVYCGSLEPPFFNMPKACSMATLCWLCLLFKHFLKGWEVAPRSL